MYTPFVCVVLHLSQIVNLNSSMGRDNSACARYLRLPLSLKGFVYLKAKLLSRWMTFKQVAFLANTAKCDWRLLTLCGPHAATFRARHDSKQWGSCRPQRDNSIRRRTLPRDSHTLSLTPHKGTRYIRHLAFPFYFSPQETNNSFVITSRVPTF